MGDARCILNNLYRRGVGAHGPTATLPIPLYKAAAKPFKALMGASQHPQTTLRSLALVKLGPFFFLRLACEITSNHAIF